MLGRKDYAKEEIANAKTSIDRQMAAYKKTVKAVDAASDPKAKAALATFEPLFCNNMILALDRPFVHRLRMVTGKDTNPLNELELLVDSLINHDGVLRTNTVIKYIPEQSVLKLNNGDAIEITAGQFERLAKAVFEDLEARFLK
ncbi:MAG: hypothetical protein JO148_16630 [Acidimicrobiia bacterium]|nr:hypothetical protein [Acidimicrobiia bacterium]